MGEYLFKIAETASNKDALFNNLNVLFKWYNGTSDNIIYLIHAVSYFIDNLDWGYSLEGLNVTGVGDVDLLTYYETAKVDQLKLAGVITKRDYLLYEDDRDDDMIYNIFKGEHIKPKVRKVSNIKSQVHNLDEIGDELEEDPFQI